MRLAAGRPYDKYFLDQGFEDYGITNSPLFPDITEDFMQTSVAQFQDGEYAAYYISETNEDVVLSIVHDPL